MTDYLSVRAAVAALMSCSEEDLEKYNSLIESCCLTINDRLADAANENDPRILHFAAAKSYYQILLLDQSENITSFKAGDISYTASSAAIDGARELYFQSAKDCGELLKDSSLMFKAV